MGRALALLLSLVASLAFAQGAGTGTRGSFVNRGNFLKPAQYATQTALALFVDPTGNDNNDCSGIGTSACLTIQAAFNQIPFLVNHQVTVDIAAGSYAGALLMNHAFDPRDTTTGAGIDVRGAAQANFAVATGTATGTATAVATDAVGFHIVTDAAQTWTVNDLSTRFLSLTAGTGAGQVCPIIANTATAVTVSCIFSPAPVAGTSYAIVTPSTLITTSANLPASVTTAAGVAAGIHVVEINTPRLLSSFVNFQDIGFSGAFRSFGTVNGGAWQAQRIRSAPTNQPMVVVSGISNAFFLNSTATTGTSSAAVITGGAGVNASSFGVTNSFLTSAVTGVAGTLNSSTQTLGGSISATTSEIVNSGVAGNVIYVGGGGASNLSIFGGRIRCGIAFFNFGISLESPGLSTNSGAGPHAVHMLSTGRIETCGNGLRMNGAGAHAAVGSGWTFLSNGVGAVVVGGGRISFLTAVPTFTTNTFDLSVDAITSTRAAFVALVPNSIVNLNYFTAIYLQP
jgi:hypothetical protein